MSTKQAILLFSIISIIIRSSNQESKVSKKRNKEVERKAEEHEWQNVVKGNDRVKQW